MSRIEELEQWVDTHTPRRRREIRMPLNALIEDADRALRFSGEYWISKGELPGLEDAGFGLDRNAIVKIEYLKDALLHVDEKYIESVKIDVDKRRHIKSAQRLLADFSVFLEWYTASIDDAQTTDQTETIQKEQADRDLDAPDDLAFVLYEYASLAKEILIDIGELGGLSLKTVDEAYDVVSRLVDVSASPVPRSEETRRLGELKDRLATALQRELERLRKAAGFIFRDHPEIVRKFSSVYVPRAAAADYRARKINKAFYSSLKQDVPLRFLPKY